MKITPINRHWFHPKWTISIQKGPRGWKGASTPPIEAAHKRKFICSERREVVRYRCAQASPIPLGRCKSSTITAETRALTGAVFLTGGERGPVRQIALKNKRPLDAIDMSTHDDRTAFTACGYSIFGLTRRSCEFQTIKFRNETLTTGTNTPSMPAELWVRVIEEPLGPSGSTAATDTNDAYKLLILLYGAP